MNQLEKNKQTATAFYDLMFNQSQPAMAVRRYVGNEYRQHNPTVADGKEAFVDYFTRVAKVPGKAGPPQTRAGRGGLRRAALPPGMAGRQDWAGIDIFRLDEAGKIVEHWDVLQRVPETAGNQNTMF